MSDTHGGGALNGLGALISALVMMALADLMTPYGPVVLTLAIGFAALAILTGILSLLPPLTGLLRPMAGFALVNAIVGGVFIGLWSIAPKPAAAERGVIATLLPFGKALQGLVVTDQPHGPPVAAAPAATPAPTPAATPAPSAPIDEKRKALLSALAAADPAVRLRAGVLALNERDPATLAGIIDTLYRTPDPAIRQLAVKRLIAQRRGARMTLLATPADRDAQALANALQAGGLVVRTINETSGAFDGGVCGGTGLTGSVNRGGIIASGACKVANTDRNVVFVLTPTDDFQLTGEARDDQGHVAKLTAPLM